MDTEKAKDLTATGIGGGAGIDMIYTAVDGIMADGWDAPEIKLLIYGVVSIVMGFFAWKRNKPAAAQ
jgi:hypothetical protein